MNTLPLRNRRFFLRTVASGILFLFSVSTAAQANLPLSYIPPVPLPPFAVNQTINLDPRLGKVEELYGSASSENGRPFVYILQDAHDSRDAQKNIRRILHYLIGQEKIGDILFEGGFKELDNSFYDFSDSRQLNKKIWDALFRKCKISGVERAALEVPRHVRFYGIEEPEAYFKNIEAIQRIFREQDQYEILLREEEKKLNLRWQNDVRPALKKFFDLKNQFEEKRISLLSFGRELGKRSETRLSVEGQEKWAQLVRLMKIAELEALMLTNKKGIQSELKNAKRLSRGMDFIWNPEEHWRSRGHLRWYFERFADQLFAQGRSLDEFPSLKHWIGFHVLQNELSAAALFEELHRLEAEFINKLSPNPAEKSLMIERRNLNLAKKLIRFELTKKEWLTINRKELTGLFPRIEPIINSAIQNYELVSKRDGILSSNLVKFLESKKINKSVFVTGGFHAEAVKNYLKNRSISYAVIQPAIRDADRTFEYRSRIMTSTTAPVVPGSSLGIKNAEPFIRRLQTQARLEKERLISVAAASSLGGGDNILDDYFRRMKAASVFREAPAPEWSDFLKPGKAAAVISRGLNGHLPGSVLGRVDVVSKDHNPNLRTGAVGRFVNLGISIQTELELFIRSGAGSMIIMSDNLVIPLIALPVLGILLSRHDSRPKFLAVLQGKRVDPFLESKMKKMTFEKIKEELSKVPAMPHQDRNSQILSIVAALAPHLVVEEKDELTSSDEYGITREVIEALVKAFFQQFQFDEEEPPSWLEDEVKFRAVKAAWESGRITGAAGKIWGEALRKTMERLNASKIPLLFLHSGNIPWANIPARNWNLMFANPEHTHIITFTGLKRSGEFRVLPFKAFRNQVIEGTLIAPIEGKSLGKVIRGSPAGGLAWKSKSERLRVRAERLRQLPLDLNNASRNLIQEMLSGIFRFKVPSKTIDYLVKIRPFDPDTFPVQIAGLRNDFQLALKRALRDGRIILNPYRGPEKERKRLEPPAVKTHLSRKFEYEGKGPVRVARQKSVKFFPIDHRFGSDMNRAGEEIRKRSSYLAKNSQTGRRRMIIWQEGKRHVFFSHVYESGMAEPVSAILDALQSHDVLWSEILKDPELEKNLKSHYLKYMQGAVDPFFAALNDMSANPVQAIALLKRQISQGIIKEEGIDPDFKVGVENGAVFAQEDENWPVPVLLNDRPRLYRHALIQLSYNNLEGAAFYNDLLFRYSAEIFYLRAQALSKQLSALSKRHPDHIVFAPIQRVFLAAMSLDPGQVIGEPGFDFDPAGYIDAIKKELSGKLTGSEREDFLWRRFLTYTLLDNFFGDTMSEKSKEVVSGVFVRMKERGLSARRITELLSKRMATLRIFELKFDEPNIAFVTSRMLLDLLQDMNLVGEEERKIIEGKSLGESRVMPPGIALLVEADHRSMAREAARRLVNVVLNKPSAVLGLATGGTMEFVYEEVVRMFRENTAIDFSNTVSFNLDEYAGVPPGHNQSYRYYMEKHLFRPLREIDSQRAFREENTHVLNGIARNVEAEAERFVSLIREKGGIDWQILGIGSDGHFAFLEPAIAIDSQTTIDLEGSKSGPPNEIYKKVRDFNEFVVDESISVEEVSKLISTIVSIRTSARFYLGDFEDLRNRMVNPVKDTRKFRRPTTALPRANGLNPERSELDGLGRKLLEYQNTVFYLSRQMMEKVKFILDSLPVRYIRRIRLLPIADYFDTPARMVDLAIPTLVANARFFESLSEVPLRALTQTGIVFQAKEIVLVASGEGKSNAIFGALSNPVSTELPASVFQLHGNTLFLIDSAAASLLSEEVRTMGAMRRDLLEGVRLDSEAVHASSLGSVAQQQVWTPMTELDQKLAVNQETGEVKFLSSEPVIPIDFDLYLMRHGETDANARKIFQGHDDGPLSQLNEEGKKQAREGAEILADHIALKVMKGAELVILSSPLRRASETAEIFAGLVSERTGRNFGVNRELFLKELYLSNWQTRRQTGEFDADEQKRADAFLAGDDFTLKPAGGESLLDAIISTRESLLELTQRIKKIKEENSGGEVIVVMFGHGMKMGAIRALLGDRTLQDNFSDGILNWYKFKLPNARPVFFNAKELRTEVVKPKKWGWKAKLIHALMKLSVPGVFATDDWYEALNFKDVPAPPARSDVQEFRERLRDFFSEGLSLGKQTGWVPVNWDEKLVKGLMNIQHPSIPKFRKVADSDGYKIKWVKGERWIEWIRGTGGLSEEEFLKQVISWTIQIGGALKEIHKSGLHHGDVHIKNIVIEATSKNPVLVDFDDSSFYTDLGSLRRLISSSLYFRKKFLDIPSQHLLDERLEDISKRNGISLDQFVQELKTYYEERWPAPVPVSAGASLGEFQKLGVSRDAVIVIKNAAGNIYGFDLRKVLPDVYAQIMRQEFGAVNQPGFIERLGGTQELRKFFEIWEAKEHAVVITGPISPEAILAGVQDGKSIIVHYSSPEFKRDFDEFAARMLQSGNLTREKIAQSAHLIDLGKNRLSEAEFYDALFKGRSLDFDSGRHSLNWIKRIGGLSATEDVSWLSRKEVIDRVIEKGLVRSGLPLETQELLKESKEGKIFYDTLRLGLAVKLAKNPKDLIKQGYVTFENGRYSLTEHFFDTFLNNALLKQQVAKLLASAA